MPAFQEEGPSLGGTPEAIDIHNVRPDSGDGNLEKTLALGGFEKQTLFLSKPVADPAASDLCTRRLAAAQPLHVVLVGFWHGFGALEIHTASAHLRVR